MNSAPHTDDITPMRSMPEAPAPRSCSSFTVPSHSAAMARARAYSARPASVMRSLRPACSNSAQPSSDSSACICAVSGGCDMCSARAAPDTVPSSTTAMKYLSCLSSMRPPPLAIYTGYMLL